MIDDTQVHDQQRQAMEELEWRAEEALRWCLTHGMPIDDLKLLCCMTGITYQRVTGESCQGRG